MKILAFCIVLFSFAAAGYCGDKPDSVKTLYEKVYDQFSSLTPDPGKVADVTNLVLVRDVARFSFHKGKFYFCKPVENRTCAAVFIGEGSFQFTPPGDVEQDQLFRFKEHRSLDEQFSSLLFIFADTTAEELQRQLTFGAGTIPVEAERIIRDCLGYMGERDSKFFPPEIIKPFIEQEMNDLFFAQVGQGHSPLFFEIDPHAREQVSLSLPVKTLHHKWTETINQFCRQGDSPSVRVRSRKEGYYQVQKYVIDASFKSGLEAFVQTHVSFASLLDDQRSIYFELFPDLKIDSVFWEDGSKANVFQGEDNYALWIDAKTPLVKKEAYTLNFYYHGSLLREDEDLSWVNIKDPDYWFPSDPWRKKALFDMSLHAPSRYTLVGTGDSVSAEKTGDIISGRWVTPSPTRNASFNIGLFKPFPIHEDSLSPVTVYMAETGHRELARALEKMEILSGRNMDEYVGDDIKSSLRFFGKIFGPAPMRRFTASEIPGYHGEAYPGMIHLSWITFQNTASDGFDQIFRAHEVAHQWWGIGVGYDSYHDEWLSEGFADFSGLWYLQAIEHKNDKYFDMLKKWKNDILTNRKFLLGSGQESGPISLGIRTESSSTSGDYDLIIYKKGAWVLHMLRNMFIDQKTMNEDLFRGIMHDFYTTYRDSSASTLDFETVCERHSNMDLGWFFKEWIEGTHIPKYKFAYKIAQTPEHKFIVTCRVEDEDAPDDFKMVVPLYIDFGGDRFVRLRAMVTGKHSEFDLPVLPLKPEKIRFNDLESVLCEVDEVGWK